MKRQVVELVHEALPSGKLTKTWSLRLNGEHIYRFDEGEEGIAEAVACNLKRALRKGGCDA